MKWDMAARERDVATWLASLARRPRFQRPWRRQMHLRDAYERGYLHGDADRLNQQERPPLTGGAA